jgi:hypothetical protein
MLSVDKYLYRRSNGVYYYRYMAIMRVDESYIPVIKGMKH